MNTPIEQQPIETASGKSSTLAGLSQDQMRMLVMILNRLREPAQLRALQRLASELNLNFDELLQLAKEMVASSNQSVSDSPVNLHEVQMKAERAVLECGLVANDALQAYVAIHNRIFAEQATLTSLLKNLIGKGVSFEALLEDSKAAHQLWIEVNESANATRANYRAVVSDDEALFLDALVEYAEALLATTAVLVERQQLLLKRKHQPTEVTWEACTDVQSRYDAAVTRYTELGGRMNARMQRVFDLAELRLRTEA